MKYVILYFMIIESCFFRDCVLYFFIYGFEYDENFLFLFVRGVVNNLNDGFFICFYNYRFYYIY